MALQRQKMNLSKRNKEGQPSGSLVELAWERKLEQQSPVSDPT